jgi:branched-chain amino acid transport system substrate-binding protein
VFGTYSIDKNGGITLTPYGIYRIEDGALVFDHTVKG